MSKIKEVRAEIAALLVADTELTTTLQVHTYASRQLPGRFERELCVFSGGSAPERGAVLGGGNYGAFYQYVLLWLIKFETDELAAAEDVSDDVEQVIYRVLLEENKRHTLWSKLVFPGISLRPVAPGGTQNAHYGRTVVRINI
ncbi:MAG: hypothetical protein DRI46_08385 [Chloroflexi bacterium]|nr:MAG: hypothetical protein DRI46_08385 [Chloroflexota bacterium]